MLNLKKTAVAVLAFGSSAVFAGTMGPVCTPGNVTVPCERSAWDFGVKALYLKPSYSGINYFGTSTSGTAESYNRFNDNWGWGFKLEGSYHFNTGNDLNLNWYHFNRSSTRTFAGPFVDPTAAGVYLTNVSATVRPKWDAVNLEFGQHVDFSDMANVRFHAGAQYARINSELSVSATGAALTSGSLDMKYNGFGPRFGTDLAYDWGNGFGVYGNAAMALLVGTGRFNTSSFSGATAVASTSGSSTVIVPELEAKLGAVYTYAMAQGDLSLDVGWMWVNYFNAQQLGVGAAATVESDFGVQGPYIGLKWVGNVA